MADVVGPRNLRQGFASLASRQGFSLLMLCEGRLATKLHASNLRSLPAFGSPRQDQMPLKLGKAPSIPRSRAPPQARLFFWQFSARRCRFRRPSFDRRTSITNANTPRIAIAVIVVVAADDNWRHV